MNAGGGDCSTPPLSFTSVFMQDLRLCASRAERGAERKWGEQDMLVNRPTPEKRWSGAARHGTAADKRGGGCEDGEAWGQRRGAEPVQKEHSCMYSGSRHI